MRLSSENPFSTVVGTLGKSLSRRLDATASARMVPASMWLRVVPKVKKAIFTWPPNTAVAAADSEPSGTWVISILVFNLTSSPMKCGVVPGPAEP